MPRTPDPLDGVATPFLGIAVLGSGAAAAAIDSYGSVVELRAPGPAGAAIISTPYKRQVAGSVDENTGIVLRVGAASADGAGSGDESIEARPLWQAERLSQRYLPRSNVLETVADVGGASVRVRDAMAPRDAVYAREVELRPSAASPGTLGTDRVRLTMSFNFDFGGKRRNVEVQDRGAISATASDGRSARCEQQSRSRPTVTLDQETAKLSWVATGALRISLICRFGSPDQADVAVPGVDVEDRVREIGSASMTDTREELAAASGLAPGAPRWAHRLHERSLLALLALVDRDTGAMPAGLRDHWHYIWPRDAATAALALSEAGLKDRADAIARFIAGLDVEHAARFNVDGSPVSDGRHEQGDSIGWARLAFRAAGLPASTDVPGEWRNRGDYGERDGERGDFLGNAIVAGASANEIESEFRRGELLVRGSSADSGTWTSPRDAGAAPILDTAAAWAVRPFPRPELFPLVRNTLLEISADVGPFGIFPSTDWRGHDPWTAATASTAWSLAALGERRAALRLMKAVRSAATPLGTLPERASVASGIAHSTTPLGWSHAFTVLALQELWPPSVIEPPIRTAPRH